MHINAFRMRLGIYKMWFVVVKGLDHLQYCIPTCQPPLLHIQYCREDLYRVVKHTGSALTDVDFFLERTEADLVGRERRRTN
jgi:hypothetical protein